MNAPVTLIQPTKAVRLAADELLKHGFFQVSKNPNSRYYARRGSTLKIRVSDHARTKQVHDIIADIVFDSPTIQPDIEIRVKYAVKSFEDIIRIRRSGQRKLL